VLTLSEIGWWVLWVARLHMGPWRLHVSRAARRPRGTTPDPKGPWVIRYTGRYCWLWTGSLFVLAAAAAGGWYLGLIDVVVDGALDVHESFYVFILAVALVHALSCAARGYRGRSR